MMRRGFTIVEVIITITVMAILLTLAVVVMSSSERNARDSERVADMESFALSLENFYRNADPAISGSGAGYPYAAFVNTDDVSWMFPNLKQESVRAPGVSNDEPISVVSATNNVETITGVTPQPDEDTYVYQPISNTGSLCVSSGDCRSYNLYYYQEATEQVVKITSKQQ